MQKDQSYHESAIKYNEGIAEFAENLAPELEHEEVQKWCTSVGKQHRFHAKRHRSALNKLLLKKVPAPVEAIADGLDVPAPIEDAEEIATPNTDINVSTDGIHLPPDAAKVVEPEPEEKDKQILPDGCTPFHVPSNPTCEFYPKES